MADLTPTLLDAVRFRMGELFVGNQQTSVEFHNSPVTLQGLALNQTALITEGFKTASRDGRTCVSRAVEYIVPDDVALGVVSATPIALDCTIPAGSGVDSFKKDYEANLFTKRTFTISDKDCDNSFKFADLVARKLMSTMALISRDLNRAVIASLQANSQVIDAANSGSGTPVGTTLQFPASRFSLLTDPTMSLLSELETIAVCETMAPNFLVLDGKNFNQALTQSVFNQLNDDGRAARARLVNGHSIYSDLRELEGVTGDKSTFLVDPNMYAFYSAKIYSEQERMIGDDKNTVEFSLPLKYKDYMGNVQSLTYRTAAGIEEAYVNIRYQRVCNAAASTSLTGTVLDHTWEVSFAGMFDYAPETTGKTGIINVVNA